MATDDVGAADAIRTGLSRYEQRVGRSVPAERLDLARPAVRACYRAFGRPGVRTRLKPAAAEVHALRSGRKPMLRLLPRVSELDATRAQFESDGFPVIRSEHLLHEHALDGRTGPASGVTDARMLVYVGRDVQAMREAMAVDEELSTRHLELPEWKHATTRLGQLLGYPSCCVELFARHGATLDNAGLVALAASRSSRFDPLLDNTILGAFHLLSWAPCRYDCEPSVAFARAVLDDIAGTLPGEASDARKALSCPRLYVDDRLQLLFDGELVGPDRVAYRAVHTPCSVDRNRAEAAYEWAFYADVAPPLLQGDSAVVRGDRVEAWRGAKRVGEVRVEGAVWLPFASR